MAKYGLNQVTLIGNLGKDPELKYLDQGIALANLWLACTERSRDKSGSYVDRTEWVSVNLWRGQAELAAKYCRKGSTIGIEGRLVTRSWETPQGEKRSRTEVEGKRIILLDSAPSALSTPLSAQAIDPNPQPAQPVGGQAPAAPTSQPTLSDNPDTKTNGGSTPTPQTEAEDLDDLPF